MIVRVEARGYRCLLNLSRDLRTFQVLVGPNASGKTTFLDVPSFLSDVASVGPEAAVEKRTDNFADLTWRREGRAFELAIEAAIPEERRVSLGRNQVFDRIRYEVAVGVEDASNEVGLLAENVLLKKSEPEPTQIRLRFPESCPMAPSILTPKGSRDVRRVVTKVPQGNDNFYSEVHDEAGKGWFPSIKRGHRVSALGNLPADETRFPVSSWLKDLLASGVQSIVLNSILMRKACPPARGRAFRPDGSNLPWVVADLETTDRGAFERWIQHLRTALPDLEGIRVVEREDDRHRYLMLRYRGGLEIPSWVTSDGTLRLLALTVPAYLPVFRGVYLIEEPENGIHPTAVETAFLSMSSVYDAQVLLATHSPVILSIAQPDQVLCFAKTEDGFVDVVAGNQHPALRDWRGIPNLSVLYASGVLG